MSQLKNYLMVLFAMVSLVTLLQAESSPLPHLKKNRNTKQLIVDGEPFLMRAGELGNSSASSKEYMKPIWDKLEKNNLNTLLAPVYWELLEPQEGEYDFTHVDNLIYTAREHNMKLVFLWFGTWKNSMSCYAPLWVKKDQARFQRARQKDGTPMEIISPFSKKALQADKEAFVALMKHIKKIDSEQNTVLMMQVENEIGMIPEARDYSNLADEKFNQEVPEELIHYIQKRKESLDPKIYSKWKKNGFKKEGDWKEIFGSDVYTDEIFMAWYYGKYVNQIAKAGKDVYSIPFYINAALNSPDEEPGEYPSAGPLPHLFNVWRAAASQIDFLAPDIYFSNFKKWSQKYDKSDNPLFIPEVDNSQSITNAFFAFAEHGAMGYSPFSIESMPNPGDNRITKAYDVLQQLEPLILDKQGGDEIRGVLLDSVDQKASIRLGDYVFNVRHEYTWPYAPKTQGKSPRYGGMIIKLSANEFIIAGSGIVVKFDSQKKGYRAGIGEMEEGQFIDGKWNRGRRMNGDQSHQGRHMHLSGQTYSIQKVTLYGYK